jgi:Flp pilus assembly pilin Flp
MEVVQKLVIRAREALLRDRNAQTMTEYVMILAAIAVAVFGTYLVLGNSVSSFAEGADSVLTNA